MNAQDVLNRARTEGVELIRFMYCDFTGVQRGKVTAIDDLANRLSHGINLTTAQMAFTLINTIVPIAGMSPVGELRLVPDPETFTILPWMPEHASMNCDLLQKNGERYSACPRTFLKDVIKRAELTGRHAIQREALSVRNRMSDVLKFLGDGEFHPFEQLFNADEGRLGIVVTFLAMLELAKETLIEIMQSEPLAPIYLKSLATNV